MSLVGERVTQYRVGQTTLVICGGELQKRRLPNSEVEH
jgi:hypothetical protein